MKDKKVKENMIYNLNNALQKVGRSSKKNNVDSHRAIQIVVVSSSTKEKRLVKSMEKI